MADMTLVRAESGTIAAANTSKSVSLNRNAAYEVRHNGMDVSGNPLTDTVFVGLDEAVSDFGVGEGQVWLNDSTSLVVRNVGELFFKTVDTTGGIPTITISFLYDKQGADL